MAKYPFHGVNGQPYLDLTPHISTDGLDEVAEEMALFYTRHGPFRTVMFDKGQALLPGYAEELGFDPQVHPRSKPMLDGPGTAQDYQTYNSFFSPVLPLEQFINLRWTGKDHEMVQYIPKTMEWINRLPCTGARITAYFSSPGQMMGAHCDSPTYAGYNPPLIYINPLLKPFYVMDGEGNKHIVDAKIAHFNNQDFHGMDQNNYRSCFSIRVGGLWEEWLVDATNTREHFANVPRH